MTADEPRVAPYGSWASPISAAMLAEAGIRFGQLWLEDGRRPLVSRCGRTNRVELTVVAGSALSPRRDVTPEGFNVRTLVHEYGGGAYLIHRGTVVFSHFDDQRLYRTTPEPSRCPSRPRRAGGIATPTAVSPGRHDLDRRS